ncbi:hypothetical protein [Peredibacter starrii]|uniref:Uncharacterized protein n=1 Tax=Peredibacter starrii TaxID=28202 RepID=A0AAX4HKF5_9BACT|nr:hypothetical protein [Peredibacter starrii]WPU63691.1 hypothetical protein SOO65_13430 [Peredibacter starrii]
MKLIFALSLILVCQFAFANHLPEKQGDLVIRAIRQSLETNDLKCDQNSGYEFRASGLHWKFISEHGLVFIIEGEQPVIKLVAEDGSTEFLLDITTNEDFTIVTKISGQVSNISKSVRNVGTIINPRFEEVTLRTGINKVICQ